MSSERAVIFVESGTSLRSSSSLGISSLPKKVSPCTSITTPTTTTTNNASSAPAATDGTTTMKTLYSSSNDSSASGSDNGSTVPLYPAKGASNYVIKIQIGEETVFNPVRIDVSSGSSGGRPSQSSLKKKSSDPHLHRNQTTGNRLHYSIGGGGEDSVSPLEEEVQSTGSSGQSSPRSDMTPPPRMTINSGAGNRFGSETSESDTESDVSSEYRPLSCPAAQFAMREIIGEGGGGGGVSTPSPPLPKSIMKKVHQHPQLSPPPLPDSVMPSNNTNNHNASCSFTVIGTVDSPPTSPTASSKQSPPPSKVDSGRSTPGQPPQRNGCSGSSVQQMKSTPNDGNGDNGNTILDAIMSLSESMALKRAQQAEKAGLPKKGEIIYDQTGFHVNEMDGFGCLTEKGSTGGGSCEANRDESLSNFAGYRDIFSRTKSGDGPKQILSDKGTIRGVKNRVRDGIATFLQSKDTKTYSEKEHGRVVVYTTSMGVVRTTFQRCQKVKQILRNLLVKFDERDCYMNRAIQNEIRQRLPHQHLTLPQIFLEGQLLGDADIIEKLNEGGELRDLLKPYKSLSVLSTCVQCGGFRMLPCPICNGSKKSVHRNHFTTEFIALKCMHCDPSGLVRCDLCNAPDS